MIVTKALIGFNTHECIITVDDAGSITVFKYCEELRACDYDSFDINNQTEAADYIMTPLKTIVYSVKFPGE